MDEVRIPPAGDPFTASDRDLVPHACNEGWVSMSVVAIDEETGEEVVEEALYLCRRCAEEGEERF
jgi:hypothetical protein